MTPLEIFLTVLSVIASVCAIAFGYKAYKRNERSDTSAEATTLATIQADIKYVRETVGEIKNDVSGHGDKLSALEVHQAKTDTKIDNLSKRVDKLEAKTA